MTNLKTIAKRAGVSISTASRALNDHPSIKPETKQEILRIARELSYEVPSTPRSLAIGRSRLIGFIIPDISNPFFSEIAKGVENTVRKSGYSLIMCNSDGEIHQEKTAIREMKRQNIDGLIIFPSSAENRHLHQLKAQGTPVVLVGSDEPGIDYVKTDDERGAYRATQHLIGLGHRRIAFISARIDVSGRIERLNGYKKALIDSSIRFDESLVLQGSAKRQHGYQATLELMRLENPPTAILSQNDLIAVGVFLALDELGKKAPDDIAVVGYDDTILASVTRPLLTSVAQPKYEMGRLAAERLVNILETEDEEGISRVVLQPTLVVRDSTVVQLAEAAQPSEVELA